MQSFVLKRAFFSLLPIILLMIEAEEIHSQQVKRIALAIKKGELDRMVGARGLDPDQLEKQSHLREALQVSAYYNTPLYVD